MKKIYDVLESKALLDKITFSGIHIEDIADMETLVNKDMLTINIGNRKKYLTTSLQEFSNLKISDDIVDSLKAGVKNKPYCILQTSIHRPDNSNNLMCYTVDDYKKALETIRFHLIDEYGIITNFKYLKMKQVEINKTFRLDNGKFNDYKRVFKLLLANLPAKSYLKDQIFFMEKNKFSYEYGTFYAKSGKKTGIELKIYDKTKSLIGFIQINDSYARVEFKLKGTAKIKKELGTNMFYELTDQVINDWYNKKVQELFIVPTEQWKQKRDKEVLALMKKLRSSDTSKFWVSDTVGIIQDKEVEQEYPLILDIEEILPLLNQLGLTPNRKSKLKNSFKKQAEKVQKTLNVRDDLRLAEILDKLARGESEHTPLHTPLKASERETDGTNRQKGGIPKIA